MGARILAEGQAGQGPRLAVHGPGGAQHRAAGGGAWHFRVRGLPRLGPGALRSGGDGRPVRRSAQDLAGVGAALERSAHRSAAATDAAAILGGGHRLAPAAVLRPAGTEPQRTLLRRAETRHDEVSRLRLGLHRGVRAPLHGGPDLGAAPRVDGGGAAATAGHHPRKRLAQASVFCWTGPSSTCR